MICPDCGGKRYHRNPDNRRRRFERSARQGDFRSQVQLLQLKMRSGEIPVDYVRRAAALGDRRAQALGLELWPVDDSHGYQRFMWSILADLPKTLLVSFSADVAERVLHIFEDVHPNDTSPRDAIEAAKRWVEDPGPENTEAALDAADDAYAAADEAAYYVRRAAYAANYAAITAAITDDAYATAYYAANSAHYARAVAYDAAYYAAAAHAADDADDADDAANYATWEAYYARAVADAEQAWQKQRLIKYLLGEIEI